MRKGFWLTVGLGYGSAGFGCSGCASIREGGISGVLGLGGTINPHLQLGFESDSWLEDTQDNALSVGTGTLTARWYPSTTGGLFFKGGVGFGYRAIGSGSDDQHTGLGLNAGLGYDIAVSRKVALSPTLSYSRAWLGDVEGLSNYHIDVIHVGVAFTLP